MKILIFDYDDKDNPFAGGGQAEQTRQVSKRLAEKHKVTIITGKFPNAAKRTLNGVGFERIGIGGFGPTVSILSYWLLVPLVGLVKARKFDIILECFTAPFAVSLLPLFVKIPIIALPTFFNPEKMTRKYKIIPFGIFEKLILNKYKNFAVLTREIEEKIKLKTFKAMVKVIPGGVDRAFLKRRPNNGDYILYLGRIDIYNKGLKILLNAVEMLVYGKNIKIKLTVAGDGKRSDLDEFKSIIRRLKLENHVNYVGKVTGEKKIRLLANCKFVVYPSLFETFGYVPLETLASGKHLVCFNIEGLKWIPDNLALKLDSNDSRTLSWAIESSLVNIKAINELSLNRVQYASNFTWEKCAESFEKFINQVIKPIDGNLKLSGLLKDKKTLYFISPHFDDAFLSAGNLIINLAEKFEIIVINVFTEGSKPPYTFSAKKFLKACGAKNAIDLYRIRKEEDERVYKKLGIKSLNLGYPDAIFRKKQNIKFYQRIIPELSHVYPTYKFHITKNEPSKKDRVIIESIERDLRTIVSKSEEVLIFCPLADGSHVDHLIVKNVCKKLFDNVIYWSDATYNKKRRKELVEIRGDIGDFKEIKHKLVKYYKSQSKALFPNGMPSQIVENYFIPTGGSSW